MAEPRGNGAAAKSVEIAAVTATTRPAGIAANTVHIVRLAIVGAATVAGPAMSIEGLPARATMTAAAAMSKIKTT